MEYQTTAVPIHTQAEFDAAVAAGARIEYTCCGDDYDLPPHYERGSAGWIPAVHFLEVGQAVLDSGERFRAFYPATFTESKA